MKNTDLAQRAFQQNVDEYVDQAMVSAHEILSHVLSLVQPKSIVDVGCGGAAWLSVCCMLGVEDILGIDGDYVELSKLKIPRHKFQPHDLKHPLVIQRRFDLAMSLEVAEHLPGECAETFVDSLIRLAPIVMFSGAIPFQGGVGHVNEQWPTYWARLFGQRGYQMVDCIRHLVWDNDRVNTWYKQNIVLFVEGGHLASNERLAREAAQCKQHPLNIVHPNRYLDVANPAHIDFREVPFSTARAALYMHVKRAIRSRLHWRLQRLVKV